MANVEDRFHTFLENDWVFEEGSCCALNMAKAGFICTARTSAKCYYCDKELDSWEEDDDPWQEHKRHADKCPFVRKYRTSSEPPSVFTTLEMLQLEKEKLLLQVDRKYEEAKMRIGETFEKTEKRLMINEKSAKSRKTAKDNMDVTARRATRAKRPSL